MMIAEANPSASVIVHPSQQNPLYAARKPPSWQLTYRRGDATRSYRIRPVVIGSALGALALMLVAYVGATAYLICRDGLLDAAVSRQVRMQYAYEERIAALREELDRMTSRHAVQTEGVAQQVATLLQQQALIERRQSALDGLVDQAHAAGLAVAATPAPLPRARPGTEDAPADALSPPAAPDGPTDGDIVSQRPLKGVGPQAELDGNLRPVLMHVGSSLDKVESTQSAALDALSAAADSKVDRMTRALTRIGAKLPDGDDAEGGPFIPAQGLHFVERAALLKRTLGDIASLQNSAAAMPLGAPVKALYISSPFGNRVDPFLKRPAFHSGIDFVAEAGTLVRATAPGTVTSAGLDGGYGEMVEIAHADGVSTRYGHLSQILVSQGTRVAAGTPIGRVGTTGRSTGPHLHYETRRNGEAVDPATYLAAGQDLRLGS